MNIAADLSNLADLAAPLATYASGGFQYGCDEFDNPATDSRILGDQTSDSINPRVFEADKVYNGPEGDETATGPNYVQSYDLIVNIADGRPISDLVIPDMLPPNHVYVGVPSVTINGSAATLGTDYNFIGAPPTVNLGLTSPDIAAPPWTAPSSFDDLQIGFANTITGTANARDVVVTVQLYIAESREGTPPPVVIDPSTGDQVLEDNTVNASVYWVPLDSRDGATTAYDSASGPFVGHPTVTITENPLVAAQNSSGTYTFSLSSTAASFGGAFNYTGNG